MDRDQPSNAATLSLQQARVSSGRDTTFNFTNQSVRRDAKEILQDHVCFGALFNSAERFDPPKCHPDTRVAVLDTIDRWAHNEQGDAKSILWLRGAAGAGKSAVAQTSAEKWAKRKTLAASFFFSRTATGRNNSTHFVATLAYQVSRSIPSTWLHMEQALLGDIGLFHQSLHSQITELIIEPLKAVVPTNELRQMVILIDGLDECCTAIGPYDHEDQQREILEVLMEIVRSENLPLHFFITSRPERQIRTSFQAHPFCDSVQTVDLSIAEGSNEDIELYVRYTFDTIRSQHPHLGSSWPLEDNINLIVRKSSGHFIYASTAMKYIGRPRYDPQNSLDAVINVASTQNTSENPFGTLDALYLLILHTVASSSLPAVLQVFQVLCFDSFIDGGDLDVFEDIHNISPSFLDRYFFLPPGSTYRHLLDLHSIVKVPERDECTTVPVQFIHASFSEFLTNHSRSQSFFLDRDQALEKLHIQKLRHIYVQILSPDCGKNSGYIHSHFFHWLLVNLSLCPPSDLLVDGLLSLVGNNQRFSEYLNKINLSHMGTVRVREPMLEVVFGPIYTHLYHSLYSYLEKCGVQSPESLFSRENIERALTTSGMVSDVVSVSKENTARSNGNASFSADQDVSPSRDDVVEEKKGVRKRFFQLKKNVAQRLNKH